MTFPFVSPRAGRATAFYFYLRRAFRKGGARHQAEVRSFVSLISYRSKRKESTEIARGDDVESRAGARRAYRRREIR